MKKLFVGFIVFCQFMVLAALFGSNAYIHVLKNRLADANLLSDLKDATIGSALDTIRVGRDTVKVAQAEIDRLRAENDAQLALQVKCNAKMNQAAAVLKIMTDLNRTLSQRDINALVASVNETPPTVAVNEKQGAHTFVYVEADSWVDLLNGERVPAMRKIAPAVDVDPNPKARWGSGPPIYTPLSFFPFRGWNGGPVTHEVSGTGGWSQ